jgi:hypothetical protein
MKFPVGTRVRLLRVHHAHANGGYWNDGPSNPYWDQYRVTGTVDSYSVAALPYDVKWDNGGENSYYEEDLVRAPHLYSGVEPVPGKSYVVTLLSGNTFTGWWDTGLMQFYEYGTTAFSVQPGQVMSIREISWEEAVGREPIHRVEPSTQRKFDFT